MPGGVVLTGGSGFIGREVASQLRARGREVLALSTRDRPELGVVRGPALTADADWSEALRGAHAVIHAAARVHVMNDASPDPLAEFRAVNVEGTLRLAQQAVEAGVKQFVLVSSIKVNGERSMPGRPFIEDDPAAPEEPYSISKHEAEVGVRALAAGSGMSVTVVRPPLVYGPGVKANFERMMNWVARGVPLPLGCIENRRSFVGLTNLADLLCLCATHPAAEGRTFLAADGEDISTTELLLRLGRALGRPARLLPVPPVVLAGCFRAIGKAEVAGRLLDSLQVDASAARRILGWKPPRTVDEELEATARHFLATRY
ncbi:NAD-dependent epimerase/dehydratase family protein [Azoarcus sp. TTM-91]|uniref:NAD-dependent epimerase/dehydratase family protein n=1 Tax=Azoarcus sp. TTM-91 TaxID=2691581 RepID=UPI00145EDA03|nr:NAD-dependent epimerase/dehydratase family protein [Azoarcus sp. TTM-91]